MMQAPTSADIPHDLAVMAEQCTARSAHGVVCAAAPLAASAGADVLRRGGNAYDAVVAMALAEGVLLPPKCGLGGDLVALALPAGADAPDALLAIGGAPSGLADAADHHPWRDVGATSVGPPAGPAGLLALAARGRRPLDELAAPALRLAVDGFPWAAVATDLTRLSVALLQEMHPEGCTYLVDGRPIERGTIVRLPRLAAAIADFAERREGFLAGPVGAAIVRAVSARGGVL
ncbi:MAG TPA: gamma-glutamyltransferase, partial [Acidimicrobiales bacterium]